MEPDFEAGLESILNGTLLAFSAATLGRLSGNAVSTEDFWICLTIFFTGNRLSAVWPVLLESCWPISVDGDGLTFGKVRVIIATVELLCFGGTREGPVLATCWLSVGDIICIEVARCWPWS